jgi:hypothetical protein
MTQVRETKETLLLSQETNDFATLQYTSKNGR